MLKPEDIKVGAEVYNKDNSNKTYIIKDIIARMKVKGVWYDCISYAPNYDNPYTLFVRTVNDFMSNFELVK